MAFQYENREGQILFAYAVDSNLYCLALKNLGGKHLCTVNCHGRTTGLQLKQLVANMSGEDTTLSVLQHPDSDHGIRDRETLFAYDIPCTTELFMTTMRKVVIAQVCSGEVTDAKLAEFCAQSTSEEPAGILDLSNCTHVTQMSSLLQMTQVYELNLDGCCGLSGASIAECMSGMECLEVMRSRIPIHLAPR
jgi:hypothetical protein